jgi:hypothetical protein
VHDGSGLDDLAKLLEMVAREFHTRCGPLKTRCGPLKTRVELLRPVVEWVWIRSWKNAYHSWEWLSELVLVRGALAQSQGDRHLALTVVQGA